MKWIKYLDIFVRVHRQDLRVWHQSNSTRCLITLPIRKIPMSGMVGKASWVETRFCTIDILSSISGMKPLEIG